MKSLYVHIPFCLRKCFYCSFSVVIAKENAMRDYLDCLQQEAALHKKEKIKTVYMGGGTPSRLDTASIKRLLDILRSHFIIEQDAEWTFETNPEDLNKEKLQLLFDLGINRVSLGVQSFHDKYLKSLGRCHDGATALKAYSLLKQTGFKTINIDLMYAFEGQSADELKRDLETVISLNPQHVSLYTLTVEKPSRFYVRHVGTQGHQIQSEMYQLIIDKLAFHGIHQYEVSNFARRGHESLHNLNYWQSGNYIGLGVAAHSHHNGRRSWNIDRFNLYMKRVKSGESPLAGEEHLNSYQRFKEALVFGLRMNKGVNLKSLCRKFRCNVSEETKGTIKNLVDDGFLINASHNLKATERGRIILDELSVRLI